MSRSLPGAPWVLNELKNHHAVTLSRAITFTESDLMSAPAETEDEETGEPVFRFPLRHSQRRILPHSWTQIGNLQ